jgi:hypothetical protein
MDVQLVLLRALAGMGTHTEELPLRPGVVLGARVLEGGAILLNGVKLAARLPEGVEPGTFLRVRVQEATSERLVLQVVERQAGEAAAAQAAPAAPAPVPTVGVPLPGGAVARLMVEPDGDGAEGPEGARRRSMVTLRYESAGLGRVDLALALDGGVVRAIAHAPAGEVAERLRGATGDLREALQSALGRPASVDVIAHLETVNVAA